MKTALGNRVRLLHILNAIEHIEDFIRDKTKQSLYDDVMFRSAVERQLEIIGEAANRLSADVKAERNDVEWQNIVGFRNFIIHEYFGVDLELVWDIVANKLEPLKEAVVDLIDRTP